MKEIDLSHLVPSLPEVNVVFDNAITLSEIDEDSLYCIIVRINPSWKESKATRIILDFYSDIVPRYNVFIWQCFSKEEELLIKKYIIKKMSLPIIPWTSLANL